jgi:hypothetical protein
MIVSLVESLRAAADPATLLLASGLAVGLLFGLLAETTAFCTRAAIVETLDRAPGRPRVRLTQYLAALLVALAATQALVITGTVDLMTSLYWSVPVDPVPLVVGGLAFGVGMVLANGCPGRHLVLMASGSARSLLVLTVLGLAAYATLRGVLAYPRIGLEGLSDHPAVPTTLAGLTGIPATALTVAVGMLLAVGVLVLAHRAGSRAVLGGAAIGAVIGLGWWTTGHLAVDEFTPARPVSLSFTAPIGETLMYLLIATGDTVRFPVTLVAGVVLGALVSAVVSGRFHVRGFPTELSVLRYGGGAVLMGFGAVLALGCNIGQGLTGLATLATGSVIATAAIVTGAVLTIAIERRRAGDAHRPAPAAVSGPAGLGMTPAE